MTENDKVNILMVDDQPGKLLSYEAILSDLGEHLIKAGSARQALEILLRTEVAVVLMDVSMPELDGFQLAEMIRQHPRFEKTAIIFISGVHLSEADTINGYRRGAVDYISVPVVPEVLRAKISVFVELHRKTRMLQRLNNELEQRVEARTEQLRQRAELLELASEAIMVRDLQGTIRYWNAGAEACYGWAQQEAIGQDMHQLLRTTFPIERTEVENILLTQGSWRGNLVQRTKSGREVVMSCRKALDRHTNSILEINRDITGELHAEEALRQAERLAAMGRMAGIIAHEINNPLEAITNTFYLLRTHPSLDNEAQHYAQLAEQELERASHITRQILSFYRESKQPTPVSLPEVIDSVLELQHRNLQALRITVKRLYRSDGIIYGFPVELRQVFLNLLGNATQAMPDGGELRITVSHVTDEITRRKGISVSVTDTGVGIRNEDRERIFQPFFTTKSVKGTGLGLWISKGIIQKYEGRITFRSYRSMGVNRTCFRIFLPADRQPLREHTAATNNNLLQTLSSGVL